MNDRTAFDTATRIVAADDGTNYDDVAIALHWVTAVMLVLLWPAPGDAISHWPLFAALLLSEIAGMIATRWALCRAGEAPLLTGDPDAWRASMS